MPYRPYPGESRASLASTTMRFVSPAPTASQPLEDDTQRPTNIPGFAAHHRLAPAFIPFASPSASPPPAQSWGLAFAPEHAAATSRSAATSPYPEMEARGYAASGHASMSFAARRMFDNDADDTAMANVRRPSSAAAMLPTGMSHYSRAAGTDSERPTSPPQGQPAVPHATPGSGDLSPEPHQACAPASLQEVLQHVRTLAGLEPAADAGGVPLTDAQSPANETATEFLGAADVMPPASATQGTPTPGDSASDEGWARIQSLLEHAQQLAEQLAPLPASHGSPSTASEGAAHVGLACTGSSVDSPTSPVATSAVGPTVSAENMEQGNEMSEGEELGGASLTPQSVNRRVSDTSDTSPTDAALQRSTLSSAGSEEFAVYSISPEQRPLQMLDNPVSVEPHTPEGSLGADKAAGDSPPPTVFGNPLFDMQSSKNSSSLSTPNRTPDDSMDMEGLTHGGSTARQPTGVSLTPHPTAITEKLVVWQNVASRPSVEGLGAAVSPPQASAAGSGKATAGGAYEMPADDGSVLASPPALTPGYALASRAVQAAPAAAPASPAVLPLAEALASMAQRAARRESSSSGEGSGRSAVADAELAVARDASRRLDALVEARFAEVMGADSAKRVQEQCASMASSAPPTGKPEPAKVTLSHSDSTSQMFDPNASAVLLAGDADSGSLNVAIPASAYLSSGPLALSPVLPLSPHVQEAAVVDASAQATPHDSKLESEPGQAPEPELEPQPQPALQAHPEPVANEAATSEPGVPMGGVGSGADASGSHHLISDSCGSASTECEPLGGILEMVEHVVRMVHHASTHASRRSHGMDSPARIIEDEEAAPLFSPKADATAMEAVVHGATGSPSDARLDRLIHVLRQAGAVLDGNDPSQSEAAVDGEGHGVVQTQGLSCLRLLQQRSTLLALALIDVRGVLSQPITTGASDGVAVGQNDGGSQLALEQGVLAVMQRIDDVTDALAAVSLEAASEFEGSQPAQASPATATAVDPDADAAKGVELEHAIPGTGSSGRDDASYTPAGAQAPAGQSSDNERTPDRASQAHTHGAGAKFSPMLHRALFGADNEEAIGEQQVEDPDQQGAGSNVLDNTEDEEAAGSQSGLLQHSNPFFNPTTKQELGIFPETQSMPRSEPGLQEALESTARDSVHGCGSEGKPASTAGSAGGATQVSAGDSSLLSLDLITSVGPAQADGMHLDLVPGTFTSATTTFDLDLTHLPDPYSDKGNAMDDHAEEGPLATQSDAEGIPAGLVRSMMVPASAGKAGNRLWSASAGGGAAAAAVALTAVGMSSFGGSRVEEGELFMPQMPQAGTSGTLTATASMSLSMSGDIIGFGTSHPSHNTEFLVRQVADTLQDLQSAAITTHTAYMEHGATPGGQPDLEGIGLMAARIATQSDDAQETYQQSHRAPVAFASHSVDDVGEQPPGEEGASLYEPSSHHAEGVLRIPIGARAAGFESATPSTSTTVSQLSPPQQRATYTPRVLIHTQVRSGRVEHVSASKLMWMHARCTPFDACLLRPPLCRLQVAGADEEMDVESDEEGGGDMMTRGDEVGHSSFDSMEDMDELIAREAQALAELIMTPPTPSVSATPVAADSTAHTGPEDAGLSKLRSAAARALDFEQPSDTGEGEVRDLQEVQGRAQNSTARPAPAGPVPMDSESQLAAAVDTGPREAEFEGPGAEPQAEDSGMLLTTGSVTGTGPSDTSAHTVSQPAAVSSALPAENGGLQVAGPSIRALRAVWEQGTPEPTSRGDSSNSSRIPHAPASGSPQRQRAESAGGGLVSQAVSVMERREASAGGVRQQAAPHKPTMKPASHVKTSALAPGHWHGQGSSGVTSTSTQPAPDNAEPFSACQEDADAVNELVCPDFQSVFHICQ